MAAGVARTLRDFRLPLPPCGPVLPSGPEPPDASEDEEAEEEEAEEAEEEEAEREAPAGPEWPAPQGPGSPGAPGQLLRFSQLISGDIQRYFGRGDPACGPAPAPAAGRPPSPALERRCACPTRPARPGVPAARAAAEPGGAGPQPLGPLAELFAFGLRRCGGRGPGPPGLERRLARVRPMAQRRLPASFWREPAPAARGLLPPRAPDFSDLLASWASEAGPELPPPGAAGPGELAEA